MVSLYWLLFEFLKLRPSGRSSSQTIVNSKSFEVGELLIDIKHSYKKLKDKDMLMNISSLPVNRNSEIAIFHGVMHGFIDRSKGDGKLDSFMCPLYQWSLLPYTMDELTKNGLRRMISWRGKAVEAFLKYELSNSVNPAFKKIRIEDIPEWTGSYQEEL